MRKYILVNLIGAMNDKVTLFLETENYKEIEEMVMVIIKYYPIGAL